MFKYQGIWLPDGEAHFPEWMGKNGELVDGRGTYQIKKWRACLPWIKSWKAAVDVGVHVGLWSMQMVKEFMWVHAFEPVAAFRECFERNLTDVPGDFREDVKLYPIALGAAPGQVNMHVPALGHGIDSGGTHVVTATDAQTGTVEMRTLDSFALRDIGFVKIDCEGYEHHVLAGARDTLLRCRPCVIVEQKPHKLGPNFGITGTPACEYLLTLGAKQRAVISGDYIFSW